MSVADSLDKVCSFYEEGVVVTGNEYYDVLIEVDHVGKPVFALDMIHLFLKKYFVFWNVYLHGYSGAHIILCLATFTPLFIMTFFSIFMIIKDRSKKYYPYVLVIAVYSIGESLAWHDFDMRYRSQCLMVMFMVSAYGLSKLFERVGK